MAQVLRRHVFPIVRTPFSSSNPRFFSVVTPRQAAFANRAQHPDRRMRMQAVAWSGMANDVGLLPNTFIANTTPSLYKSPKKLLKYQWVRLRTRVRDLLSTATFKWMAPKIGRTRRKVQLQRGSIASVAEALYREMYQNLAAGNTRRLRKICTDGLYESFAQRIASRPRGLMVTWNLEKMNRRPKIMSTKAVLLPGGSGNVIRQAVVRISSRQLITLRDSKGKELPGSSEKDIVEYVVVQKIYRNWQDKGWQVWGTTAATTLKNIEHWEEMA